MASFNYNNYKELLLNGGAPDMVNDTIKVALLTSSYTPSTDSDVFWSDISANEISATGYTAGGATLAGNTVTQDNTNDRGEFDATDPTWTLTSSASIRYAVLYKSTGVASTSPLIRCIDLGTTYTVSNGTFTINFDSEGVFYIS